jgi:tRNA-specific 2-thiouridylase
MEARYLAQKLGFEHYILDYREIFRQTVISNFVSEYTHGRTPNPCVLCNSHIKWGELMRAADEFGCNYIATGHYAQTELYRGHYYLHTATDQQKDQTYFLWMLTEEQLRRTIFPLGEYTKDQVREIARSHGYEQLAVKRESQEICFIPDDDYRAFLRASVPDYNERVRAGEYVDADGKVLGTHEGFVNYTIGQRKGLGIALGHPAYVTHIDAEHNRVTLGTNDDLLATELRYKPTISRYSDVPASRLTARIRYRSVEVPVEIKDEGCLHFAAPVWGITPGQSVVLYDDDLVVGGGIIL